MTDIQEQVARALYAEYRARIPGSLTWENNSKADQFRAQAARLMPSIMPLVKRAQAEILREFANSLDPYAGTVLSPESVAEMARGNADEIEKEAGA